MIVAYEEDDGITLINVGGNFGQGEKLTEIINQQITKGNTGLIVPLRSRCYFSPALISALETGNKPGCTLVITDLSPSMLALAALNGLDKKFTIMGTEEEARQWLKNRRPPKPY